MVLKKISYKELESSKREWILEEFELTNVNLIVGANACGKSRTLNVIYGLAKIILSPKITYNSGEYSATFENDGIEYQYSISYKNNTIYREKFTRNGDILLRRKEDGLGKIYSEKLQTDIEFKIPKNELIISRIDEIQYPYLEVLHNWAQNTRHFRFSKEEEKYTLGLINSNKAPTNQFNQNISNQAIEIFRRGKGNFRERFVDQVIADFNKIGYDISNIDIGIIHSLKVDGGPNNKVVGLRVHENDRSTFTDQNEMSDGMFRALSIIIHYNYFMLQGDTLNVLVDDIGEGLDFERSSNLIRLLIEKSLTSGIQLIMSSNDMFVMNNTDLEFWQIISRQGNTVRIKNSRNSQDLFKDFKFTGLTNFDFFTTNYN
ncbi:MAG: ATP-binding protein [Balneola sp.]